MDLVKEIRELVAAIKSAAADGKVTPTEAFQIVKELVDVLTILLQVFSTFVLESAKQEDK